MDYRKERNFIVAYEGEKAKGKWDILTGEYYGVKGSLVKSIPVAFNNLHIAEMPRPIAHALEMTKQFCHSWNGNDNVRVRNKLEQLISLDLKVCVDWSTWYYITEHSPRLTKDLVTFLKDNCNGLYSEENVSKFLIHKNYRNILDKCPGHENWVMDVLRSICKDEIPSEFIEGMILRGIHEKIFMEYSTGNTYALIIREWYKMVVELQDKLEVKHNILTNYAILRYIYQEYKNTHYDELLKKHNDLSWLYYEDEQFFIRPLLTRAEFHDEAEQQQNCVERLYMERVYAGTTHVVQVRLKETPSKSYITCEVDNRGKIIQFLHKFNSRITTETDKELRRQYELHLSSSLKNEP